MKTTTRSLLKWIMPIILLLGAMSFTQCRSTVTANPRTGELILEDIPECLFQIDITITQGTSVVRTTWTPATGGSVGQINGIDFSQSITICFTFTSVGPNCPDTMQKGDTYCWTGIPTNNEDGTYSVAMSKFIKQ